MSAPFRPPSALAPKFFSLFISSVPVQEQLLRLCRTHRTRSGLLLSTVSSLTIDLMENLADGATTAGVLGIAQHAADSYYMLDDLLSIVA